MNVARRLGTLERAAEESRKEAGKETAVMTESLKQILRRVIRFLLFAVVVAVLGDGSARGQQNNIQGNNVVLGTWDASQAARTNNSRTGTGSPVGRDSCLRVGESYFQTDAAAGQNVWYCTTAGYPGLWVVGAGLVTIGASLPASCAVGQQYFVTMSGATYGLNVCIATNTWTAQSGASGSGTVTSVSASCLPWLTCPVSTATTTPALAIGAANSQTSHQVIGTCGSATAFGPCALVAGDLPSISLTTGVIGTLQAAQEPAHTGDMTNTAGSLATTVVGLNGTNLAGLSTGADRRFKRRCRCRVPIPPQRIDHAVLPVDLGGVQHEEVTTAFRVDFGLKVRTSLLAANTTWLKVLAPGTSLFLGFLRRRASIGHSRCQNRAATFRAEIYARGQPASTAAALCTRL